MNTLTKDIYKRINFANKKILISNIIKDIYIIKIISANKKIDKIYLKRVFNILIKITKIIILES